MYGVYSRPRQRLGCPRYTRGFGAGARVPVISALQPICVSSGCRTPDSGDMVYWDQKRSEGAEKDGTAQTLSGTH